MRLLLDSNTVNYVLRSRESVLATLEARIQADAVFFISDVVDYELRRYLDLKGASRKLERYERLIGHWSPVSLGTVGWRRAVALWAELHREGRSIEDRDLLIAVTALQARATLVTSNTRHFAAIPGIEMQDWTETGD